MYPEFYYGEALEELLFEKEAEADFEDNIFEDDDGDLVYYNEDTDEFYLLDDVFEEFDELEKEAAYSATRGLAGAAIGGAAGALSGKDTETRLKRGLGGAALGSLAGFGFGKSQPAATTAPTGPAPRRGFRFGAALRARFRRMSRGGGQGQGRGFAPVRPPPGRPPGRPPGPPPGPPPTRSQRLLPGPKPEGAVSRSITPIGPKPGSGSAGANLGIVPKSTKRYRNSRGQYQNRIAAKHPIPKQLPPPRMEFSPATGRVRERELVRR